jgi:uncharacterized protein RhaS with RHS repeats
VRAHPPPTTTSGEPESGQYASQDPTGLFGGPRLYGYVVDPCGLIDPFGLESMLVDPRRVNFSQRTVGHEVDKYSADMAGGRWSWERSGPLRVMEQNGELVSYDNRRLLAAREAGLRQVPIELVDPAAIKPGAKKSWRKAFWMRMNDKRNLTTGGAVPYGGLTDSPKAYMSR